MRGWSQGSLGKMTEYRGTLLNYKQHENMVEDVNVNVEFSKVPRQRVIPWGES